MSERFQVVVGKVIAFAKGKGDNLTLNDAIAVGEVHSYENPTDYVFVICVESDDGTVTENVTHILTPRL